MSDKIARIFEEFKDALKGKDPRECESEYIMRMAAVAKQAGEILANEMPKEIKKLDGNDQKKITWLLENHKTQIKDRTTEAINWLEQYYEEHSS